MFTVEIESDHTLITTLDQESESEDVQLILDDDGTVWLRQWDEDINRFNVICMSYQQWGDLYAAMNSSQGAYYSKIEEKHNE